MYLIVFEIKGEEVAKDLKTEHGWKTWHWSTAVKIVRDYFAQCVGLSRPGISPSISFQILHTDLPVNQWLKNGQATTFRLIDYVESRSMFRNKVLDDWFENAFGGENPVLSLVATVGGDVSYDKIWDRLIGNALKWKGDVSVIHLNKEQIDISSLDYESKKLRGTAIGDLTYLVDPNFINDTRRETLSQIDFFERIFNELDRREEMRKEQEKKLTKSQEPNMTYTIQLIKAKNKGATARVIAKQLSVSISEALLSLQDLPIELASGATLEQANEFKIALEEVRAEVNLVLD